MKYKPQKPTNWAREKIKGIKLFPLQVAGQFYFWRYIWYLEY